MYSVSMSINIIIKDLISKDLVLRDTAQSFFKKLEMENEKDITIDFTDIRSISRSFSHEYLLQKDKSSKHISEKNIPENIEKMFNVVKRTSNKPKLITYNSMSAMSLKSLPKN
jgi:hypothetical protein